MSNNLQTSLLMLPHFNTVNSNHYGHFYDESPYNYHDDDDYDNAGQSMDPFEC